MILKVNIKLVVLILSEKRKCLKIIDGRNAKLAVHDPPYNMIAFNKAKF